METTYLIIICFCLFGIPYLIYFYRGKILHTYYFSTGKFRTKNNAKTTSTQYRKLLLGAIFAKQHVGYLNILHADIQNAPQLLSEWWGIYNREAAIKTLNELYQNGFKCLNTEIDLNSSNLNDTYEELLANHIINNREDILKYGNLAWYSGRLSFLSRICYDLKYITEEEAWEYQDKAYNQSISHFESWESFAKSYIIGRAIWGGANVMNDVIIGFSKELLTKEDSPWKQITW